MRSDLGVLDPPSTAAVLPLHPDRVRSLFTSPVSSITNTACRIGEMVDDVVAGLLRHPVRVPDSPGQQVLPSGLASPVCSVIVQQFLPGRSASSPSRNRRPLRSLRQR